jgi:hypothetical protein
MNRSDTTGLTAQTSLTGEKIGLTDVSVESSDSAEKVDKTVKAEGGDWRIPIVTYLRYPGRGAERNIQLLAFKYVLLDDELYQRTAEDLLLKCLDSDQARVAIGEVYEGIRGTHQLAPRMKWLLRRAGFYWPSMIADCFKYYKGCEERQRFGNLQLVLVHAVLMHAIIKP